jgi:hypothetical protein
VPEPLVFASLLVLGLDYPERGDDSSPERRTAAAGSGRWGCGCGERDWAGGGGRTRRLGRGARLVRVLDHGLQFCLIQSMREEIPNIPLRVEIFSTWQSHVRPNQKPPAATDERARPKVGPKISRRRVKDGCFMPLASRRTKEKAHAGCFLPRMNE